MAALLCAASATGRASPFVRVGVKAVRGATLLRTETPHNAFVDDPFAMNASGSRLAYVSTDGGNLSQLLVTGLSTGDPQPVGLAKIDLGRLTTTPSRVAFVTDDEVMVMSHAPVRAWLLRLDGKVLAHFGPASDIRLARRGGRPVVVVYRAVKTPGRRRRHRRHGGKGTGARIRHDVAVYALPSGHRIARGTLATDGTGYSKKLDFRLVYWADAYRRAVGIKGGTWDRVSDARSPDAEGWYDLLAKRFAIHPIDHVIAHARLMRLMRRHSNEPRFVRVRHDLTGVDVVRARGGESVGHVKLTEPFRHYDPKSLIWHRHADGTVFFTLTVDPVNVDAVAHRRVVPAWIDLYELAPGSTHAVRRARMLRRDKRKVMWRVAGGRWAVVPKNIGFDRGGVRVEIYRLGRAPR